ncbi:MAG: trimethylamine methyltransferase family protein [Candidatus Latescibacterota bacterium]
MRDHLTGLVEVLDTDRIRTGAIRLLGEVGMAVPSADVARRLQCAGVRVDGGRMYLRPEVVSGFLDRHRATSPPEPDEGPVTLNAGSHNLYEYCAGERAIRRLTVARPEEHTRLVGALRAEGILASAYCPGTPADVPPCLAPLWQQFVGARFLPDPPIYAYSPAYAPFAAAMAEVLGKQVGIGVHPISPLVLGGDELELALRLLDDGMATTTSAGPMPVMGVTAPLDWIAAWSQALAEAAGTGVALEALGFRQVRVWAALYVADPQHGAFVFGSPEHALITLTEARVNRELLGNLRRPAKAIDTTAKEPGPQAAAEKTAHTLAALLAGYRALDCVGSLAVDEVFSVEQLFVDLDIAAHCWRIVRGVEARFCQGDVVELVRQGLEDQQFLTAPATLERFRDFYQQPATFDRRSTGTWLAAPAPQLERAAELARSRLKGYTYELDEARQAALRSVIARAAEALR